MSSDRGQSRTSVDTAHQANTLAARETRDRTAGVDEARGRDDETDLRLLPSGAYWRSSGRRSVERVNGVRSTSRWWPSGHGRAMAASPGADRSKARPDTRSRIGGRQGRRTSAGGQGGDTVQAMGEPRPLRVRSPSHALPGRLAFGFARVADIHEEGIARLAQSLEATIRHRAVSRAAPAAAGRRRGGFAKAVSCRRAASLPRQR